MAIGAIGSNAANNPYGASPASEKPQEGKPVELTTVTTHCDKKHWHDQSCPHSVTTRPAPKVGEPGYLLDTRA